MSASYDLLWTGAGIDTDVQEISNYQRIANVANPYRRARLGDDRHYYFSVVSKNSFGESAPSPFVRALPPPVPGTIDHVTVVTRDAYNAVYWKPAEKAETYRIYWSAVREDLESLSIDQAPSFDTTVIPFEHHGIVLDKTLYYRIVGLNGPRSGPASNIARSTVMQPRQVDIDGRFSAALHDVNGDGCLDAVGAYGDCTGGFFGVDLSVQGTFALLGPGRANRDSRFADLNGDRFVDIFTNVYSRADNELSRSILLLNEGDNSFREDPEVTAMDIGGFGETVLVADFDNDGYIDIFIPHYWHRDDGGRNWLLMNDGSGSFEDVAAHAGIAVGIYGPPEGAQALDINVDGWIDIYVASQLFINNGDRTFTDRAADYRLPARFDEGLKFVDIDLDGDLDFVHHDASTSRLYRNYGGRFGEGKPFNEIDGSFGYGINICDINNDGFEDVIAAGATGEVRSGAPGLFLNAGGTLRQTRLNGERAGDADPATNTDLIVCADLDGDLSVDILARQGGYRAWLSAAASKDTIVVRVVGAGGEMNQQGRVLHATPSVAPELKITRVIESGSGYMAQAGYDVILAAPWPGTYTISVRAKEGWIDVPAEKGTFVTIYEDGSSEASPLP